MIFMTEPDSYAVRGRALECLGHIAVAIGPQHFSRYFEMGMQSANQGMQLGDLALKEYSYVFIANCVKVMGRAFDPLLIQLVPYLLEVVSENELTLVNEEDESDNEDENDEDDDPDSGNYRVNVNDGFVNSKKAAVTAIGILAEHTKEAFFPFLEDAINAILVDGVGALSSLHHIVRAEAVSILPHFVGVACAKYGPLEHPKKGHIVGLNDIVSQVVKVSLGAFISVMEHDADKEPVAMACEGIIGVLDHVGMAALITQDDNGTHFAQTIMAAVKTLLSEKAKCQTASKFEGADDDDDDDHDNIVMDSVSDLIGALAKNIGAEFEPYFSAFHPLLLKFTKATRPYSDRAMAIGCYAEVFAEIGPKAALYADTLLPILEVSLKDSMEGVRRNAAFCLGVLVEATGTYLSSHIMQMLSWLYPLCSMRESQPTNDMGGADIDNAISSVARMINTLQTLIPLDQVLPVMLSALPLRSDHSEGENVYGCIARLMLSGETNALNLLPKILESFAVVLHPDSKATAETKTLVKSSLVQMMNSPQGQETLRSALSNLPAETAQMIENMIR